MEKCFITRPSRATAHALSACVQLVPRYFRTQAAITCTAPEGGVMPKRDVDEV